MSSEAVSLRAGLAGPRIKSRLRLEHFVMGGAIVALIVLIVLPLCSLLLGSMRGEDGLEPRPFPARSLSSRLYLHGADQLADARRLDRPVQHAHRRAAGLGGEPHQRAGQGLIQLTATPVLPVAAVPHRHRLRQPVQPQCRPDQRLLARRARPAVAHLQHLLHDRARARDGAAHLPVRLSAGVERAAVGRRVLRGGRADPRREQAAHGAHHHRAAGGARDPVRHAARLRQRHRAVRLAGDHRPARPHRHAADAHLRAVRLSAANTALPRRCR